MQNTSYDYIVVGSGMAGIHTAYRLGQRGKKVLVLEKEPYIGGRMSSRVMAGSPVDYGAKFIAPFYKNMLALAEELGVKPVSVALTSAAIKREGQVFAFDASRPFPYLTFGGISFLAKLRLGLALLVKLIQSGNLSYYKLERALRLDDKSVCQDLRPLAGAEGFDCILELLCVNVFFYGTREFSRALFLPLLPKLFKFKTLSFPGGIGQLCQKMASTLPVEVCCEVKSVSRLSNGAEVSVEQGGQKKVYEAKKVIMAAPGDRVLQVLQNPLPEEKAFFSRVRYAGTVQVLFSAKTRIFDRVNIIWTVPRENSCFLSVGTSTYHQVSTELTYCLAALREETYNKLSGDGDLNSAAIEKLLKREFPGLGEPKVIYIQTWPSAVPKFYPGYLTCLFNFQKSLSAGGRVHYCGDYMENPSTEGALTSSIKLLERLG